MRIPDDDLATIHPELLELLHAAGRACDDKRSETFTYLKKCLTAWRAHNCPVYPEPMEGTSKDDFVGAVVELVAAHATTVGRLHCGKALIGTGVGLFMTAGLSEAEVRDKILELVPLSKRLHDEMTETEGDD